MHNDGKKILNLMFRPGERVCVSPNKYGYHCIPLENVLADEVTLVPTPESAEQRKKTWEECFEQCPTNNLLLVALNPIEGYRLDENCKSFRNFLIEMDYGTNQEQLDYVHNLKMPYSAAIFSGGKSIHFLISLDRDVPNEEVWRTLNEWCLNIATLADPNCKNPSRSIRIPGAERDPGKFQQLLEYRGPVNLIELTDWLKAHPEAKPKVEEKRTRKTDGFDLNALKPWLKKRLMFGLDPTQGRNKQWFSISCEFALAGYSEDDTIGILENYYTPDKDFKRKEWLVAVRSGFDYVYRKK